MNQNVQQVIERLRTLAARDREWLLCSLSAEERRRVLAALMGENAEPADQGMETATVNGNGKDHSAESMSSPDRLDPRLAALMNASADSVADVLAGESDWTIVVLLEFYRWPWAEDFLRSLTAARMQSLREISEHVSKSVKPKVGETLALVIAGRLQRQAPQSINRSMFDMALERAQFGAPVMPSDKGVGE
jgi:hypothetical protein